MKLSNIGEIADNIWREIPDHSKNVQLGSFVVMPNHIHGILILTNSETDSDTATNTCSVNDYSNKRVESIGIDGIGDIGDNGNLDGGDGLNGVDGVDGFERFDVFDVETLHATSLQSQPQSQSQPLIRIKNEMMAGISPKSLSVSAIVRSYKSGVVRRVRGSGFDFQWQTRFYDHIIRNDSEYQRITKYIDTNPANWKTDKFINY